MSKTINLTDHTVEVDLDYGPQKTTAEQEISKVAMGLIMGMAALIGIWGLGCLLAGLTGSEGGIVEFARSWLGAVLGT